MRFDALLTHVRLATMREARGYASIDDGAIGIREGLIGWIGGRDQMPRDAHATTMIDGGGRWVTPGLVDCHTHLVYAGNRANEFEQRLEGATYAEIAAAGGGIRSTVAATREASAASRAGAGGCRRAGVGEPGV